MPTRRGRQKTADGPTLEAVMGAVIALAPAYFLGEGLFRAYPHVIHWVGTGLGIAGGYGVGALVAAYKEARPPFGRGRPDARPHTRSGQRASAERQEPKGGDRDDRAAATKRRTGR